MKSPNLQAARKYCWVLILVLAFMTISLAAKDADKIDSKAKEAANAPEAKPNEAQRTIEPAAQALLDRMQQTYGKLKAAEFSGHVKVNVDIPNDAHQTNQQFTSSFGAPNKFKHQISDGLLMVSNGGEVYIFNAEENSYLGLDLPTQKVELRNLPVVVPQVLQSQNPSLLFAISKDGLQEVALSFGDIRKGVDVNVDGREFPQLVFCSDDQESELHVLVDPETYLIRRFTIDFKPALLKGGATNVQNAEVVVEYTKANAVAEFPESYFAWTPPEGAFNVREAAGAARPEKPADHMTGVPAPNFQLVTLDGKKVALSNLKGKVVVLDFWATWSPQSAESLTTMGDLVSDEEDDLRIFAINLEEEKDKVKTFVDLKNIDLPVLLDDGRVAKSYQVKTVPQTIIIGKDGIVQKVFAGQSPDRDREIQKAIEAARSMK